MKHIRKILQSAVFLSILVCTLLAANQVLVPKFLSRNSRWPTTASYHQFYRMKKNSIDVLVLGSSVTVNAFIPQEIYNEYGIRSFNLGSEQQSLFLSYYWLREALRFQSPKAVVLDLRFIWDYHPDSPINTTESMTRKCLDPMRWSSVKREAVRELCALDESQSELSYYLTNLRYHTRWTDLQEYDFDSSMLLRPALMGFGPMPEDAFLPFEPYDPEDPTVFMSFSPVMQEYLDRTVQLCKEHDIELILLDLPGSNMNDHVNNTHAAYAKEHGISYYNLCIRENYEAIGAILPRENIIMHANIWGARKLSRFIGGVIRDTCGLQPVRDPQYEATAKYYEQALSSCDLIKITDPLEYLEALKSEHFAVFIAAHGNVSTVFHNAEQAQGGQEGLRQGLQNLGLGCRFPEDEPQSYIAVIVGGKVAAEKFSPERLEVMGSFRNRHSMYQLMSDGTISDASSSILIEGVQCSRFGYGLDIAVYDLNTCNVVDRVTLNGTELQRTEITYLP